MAVGVGNGERRATRKGEKRFGSLLLLRASELKGERKESSFHDWICEGSRRRAKGIGSASRIYRKSSKLPPNLSQSEMSFFLLCYLSAFQAQESPEPVFDLSECALKNVPSGVYSRCKVSRKEGLLLQVSERDKLFLFPPSSLFRENKSFNVVNCNVGCKKVLSKF